MSVRERYEPGEFCWVDLSAGDMQDAIKFYCALFGWEVRHEDTRGGPPYATFTLEGKAVAGVGQLSEEMKAHGVPPVWNSYVSVANVQEMCERAQKLGATITVPAMKILDSGSLAYFTDPTGATCALWQPDQHIGSTFVNGPGGFCWNELQTRDLDKAKGFYGELFGWETSESPGASGPYVSLKNKGRENGGMLTIDPSWGEVPPNWAVYFTVKDLTQSLARLEELGGKKMSETLEIPNIGPFAVVNCPQGATFVLIQLSQWD